MMRDSWTSRVVLLRYNGDTTACRRGVRRERLRAGGSGSAGQPRTGNLPIASGAFRASIVHSGNRRSASDWEVDSLVGAFQKA
jgi:hypothetical protein